MPSTAVTRRARTLALAPLLFAASASADWTLNLRPGVTPISREIYDLHMLILWICVVIGVFVFGAMFYSMFNHRKKSAASEAQPVPSQHRRDFWTVVPVLILVGMAVPATPTF